MSELLIQSPGQPEQVVPLTGTPVTIGRGEDCTAFLVEKRASRMHLVLRALADGRVVAEDQGSSNGSWFCEAAGEDQRFLRRVLEVGDAVRIGDTRITLRGTAAAPAGVPLISGTLQLTPAAGAPAASAAPAPPPASAPAPLEDDTWDEGPRARPDGSRVGLVRGLVLCGVGLAALLGVEFLLGAKAGKQTHRKDAHLEALRVLDYADKGVEAYQQQRDRFAAEFPDSPKLMTIDRYMEKLREREEYEQRKQDELNILLGQLEEVPRSEARLRLLQLRRELPGNDDFARKVQRGLEHLDRRKAEADREDYGALDTQVRTLLGAGEPARAQRLVRAFDHSHDSMDADVKAQWQGLRDKVTAAVEAASQDLWKKVGAEQDPARQRALLASAWPALVGTKDGERIGDTLRSAASLAAPRRGEGAGAAPPAPGATPGATPGTAPTVPTVADSLLARAKGAEELLRLRRWTEGRAVMAELVQATEGGRLKDEWHERLGEVDRILSLVARLAEDVAADRKPRKRLTSGTWKVTAVDPAGVTLESPSKGELVHAWGDLPEDDVVALLTPARMDGDERHALALLAASLGKREAFVAALLPLYEKGGELAASNALVARHLYGRTDVPEGGYSAYKGEILDAEGLQRRQQQERITFLQEEAERLVVQISKEPAFKKLDKLKALRDELDVRRKYALRAIFNTTHYPYPYERGSTTYGHVQAEIDRRTAAAREIWDDPYRVQIEREGKLAKLLETWDTTLQELDLKKIDVAPLKKRIQPYAMYVTGEALTIRNFYRSEDERAAHAYNRWVMDSYNPARSEVATDAERKQVEVTNEYRMLIGFTAVVTPGSAPYESITKDNVVEILDQAKVENMTPLRAVRIDNKLVASARAHSEDMTRRGYFAHQAPPNPATGEGPTGPADRMQRQGYQGWGYSENIAMSASPTQAHAMWIHSSGHHRNILSGWTDLGSGVAGRNFTQNFGNGGGARPEIQPDTGIREGSGARGSGTGRSPGR